MNAAQAAVLLDQLGLLDESQRRALVQARQADPVIRHLFRLLDPASIDPAQPLLDLADRIAAEITATPVQEVLLAFPRFQSLAESERQDSEWAARLRVLDTTAFGGFDWHGSFFTRGAAGGVKAQEFPLERQTNEFLGRDGDRIFLDCPEADVPSGLGWLILTEPNGVVTLRLPELTFDRGVGRWGCVFTVEELLSGRRPEGAELQVGFLPATEDTRAAFAGAEVRSFVDSLPPQSTQRVRAEAFLTAKE